MAVGSKLAQIIKEKGLTQKEVAEKAGISPQTLNKIIKRDSARADVQLFLKICAALEIPISVFKEDAIAEFYIDHPNAEPLTPQNTQQLTRRQERIVELFNDLTEEQQDNLIGRAEMLVELNEQEIKRKEDA